MPQRLLPLIPDGASQINDRLSVVRENGRWTYFFSTCPVFQHEETDPRAFRMFTAPPPHRRKFRFRAQVKIREIKRSEG